MSEPFLAEIRLFGFNFAPRGWATCDGQLLPLAQNTALFSLLGTNYGGNGISTFGLPNLTARFALGAGQGPGLSHRVLGEPGGVASVTLLATQVPAHSHTLSATVSPTTPSPSNALMAPINGGSSAYRASSNLTPMAATSVAPSGGGQPHENRQPYTAVNFCIALQGVFPSRP